MHTLSKYFSISLQCSVSRGNVVSRSVALRQWNMEYFLELLMPNWDSENIHRGRQETELGRDIRDLPQVRKLDCRV